ncbi:helix-turn-helix domain-containing protein [Photobacterium sp. ZSDE20]|uniref:Helix-turn-helix domain-containing protein n=1 Tax=Photobacterium pectinilyticum TaxID=2906793 RepID=A0ABT1N726_9GAMM|nr:helix-turn-helix domain-containing protein [Photobacterium sp. ZSDE20]MCQ1059639.1 helix-turn-helix domain-containing protein [Photobacterium sp. ZSDE20]
MIHLEAKEFFLDSSCAITTELRSPQEPFPEHSHSFSEIIVVSEGHGCHVLNGVPMSLSKNYVCFVNRNDSHLFEDVEDLYLSNILYDTDKLHLGADLRGCIPDDGDEGWFIDNFTLQCVQEIIDKLDKESHENTPESKLMAKILFQQLVVELWRGRIRDCCTLSKDDRVLLALNMIRCHHVQGWDIEMISKEVELSPRYLSKTIRRLTGMSYSGYFHYARACRALALLNNTDKSITEVAFDVGYQDSNYFSTKFKQMIGFPPRDVRHMDT